MIKFEEIEILSGELGNENPLPDINDNTYIHAGYKLTENIDVEERKWIGKGMINTMIPYLHQDGYNRNKKNRKFKAVILENTYLKAVFLPELGGRLWQLFDKEKGEDLLYVNPVFQPCNLALRNAWFSGGVEFNVSIKGHNPLTCSPLYCEKRIDENGKEFISMYEWERKRGVVYSINAYLPENSKVLYIKDVIENTKKEDCYMYWWSNIATPETPKTRVIVPTNESFVSFYNEDHYVVDKMGIPQTFGTDVSYPTNLKRSLDFFYKIPKKNDKWIATANEYGNGLLHFSDNRLQARKLFLWGTGNGGRHWNEFLSEKGSAYIEIQAGILNTQLEHFIMQGESRIEFIEAYAPLNGNLKKLHDTDFTVAVKEVSEKLYEYTQGENPDIFIRKQFPDIDNSKKVETLCTGSGWGYLENKVRKETNAKQISTIFDGFAPDTQIEKWVRLVEDKTLPSIQPQTVPNGYVVGKYFISLLEKYSATEKGNNFATHVYLGVALYEAGQKERANAEWEKSFQLTPNAWAYRNSASYYATELHNIEKGVDLIKKAFALLPNNDRLAIACGKMLTTYGYHQDWLDIAAGLEENIRTLGRIKLLMAKSLIALGRLDEAQKIVNEDFEMPDVKEGELSTSALWFEMYAKILMRDEGITLDEAKEIVKEKYPLPYSLDFRMHE